MVSDDGEGLEAVKVVSALSYCPNDGQTLEFYCGVVVLRRSEGARSAFDEPL